MSGSTPLSRLAGWLAIVAMAANLCIGMAAARGGVAPPAAAPACCCGEGCQCGPGCACSVAPADPAEHLPESPATIAVAVKLIPVAMPTKPTVAIGSVATRPSAPRSALDSPGPVTGQRETRLRSGICTT